MKTKVLLSLVLMALLLSVQSTGAQGQREEIIALIGNGHGDSVLVTLLNSTAIWISERPRDAATMYAARDTVCRANQVIVTACGRYVYVAVGCDEQPPQLFAFEMRSIFPCGQPTTVYVPLSIK